MKLLTPLADEHPHLWRGAGLYLLALLFFAALDAAVKALAPDYPVALVAWMRYAVHLVWMTALFLPHHGKAMVRVKRPLVVIARGLCLLGVTGFMVLTLRRLPLAEATAVFYVAPLLTVLLAQRFLHEPLGARRLLALMVGFCGVLLVVRPSAALDYLGVAFALICALCSSVYQFLTRLLSASESTLAMLYWSGLVGTCVFGLALPWVWFSQIPSWSHLGLFLAAGSFGFVGHLCFTRAYRYAPASILAPLSYTQLLWAALLGVLFFQQLPSGLSIVGMLVIVASGVLVLMPAKAR